MATLVPDLEEINSLPTPLTTGEKQLVNALWRILDDSWTIYVQPHLNGLQPDVVIFSEEAGVGIFEVKDWDLNNYEVSGAYGQKSWRVYDGKQGKWVNLKPTRCPFSQVERYREIIYKYEVPILGARNIIDSDIFGLVVPFVFFSHHTVPEINEKMGHVLGAYDNYLGKDSLGNQQLQAILNSHHLRSGSKFSDWMKEEQFGARLRNALAFAKHGATDLRSIEFKLNKKQRRFLEGNKGKRRAVGVAGSGKTLLLVRKAVREAEQGRRVLLTCFNITMSNYLRDITTRLARSKGPHVVRNILVRYYHRMFRLSDNEPRFDFDGKFDVILVDEAQDFKREWIENLYDLGRGDYHFVLVEDDRQNIYGVDAAARRAVPGIRGRPLKLGRSFRISPSVALLANNLIDWAAVENESGPIATEGSQKDQQPLFRPYWFNGTPDAAMQALEAQLDKMIHDESTGAFADIAVLVCNYSDGRFVCELLDRLGRAYIATFETNSEIESISRSHGNPEQAYQDLRRQYKRSFWMQRGLIKVSTIHSFKGWELRHILVYFRPEEIQQERSIPLLYTAVTRTQENLCVFCADPQLVPFSNEAHRQGALQWLPQENQLDHRSASGEVPDDFTAVLELA